jgi:hypothetical protein
MIRPALTHLPIIGIAALLSACAAPAGRTPADSPAAVGAARLSCFSAELPDSGGSCDEFCATRDAACVATGVGKGTLILPLPSCGDAPSSSPSMSCRCCALAHYSKSRIRRARAAAPQYPPPHNINL